MPFYRFVSANNGKKCAPLPARDVYSFLVNIRRNREAKERFTYLFWSANRAIGAAGFAYWYAHFCREQKSAQSKNSPWFRANFAAQNWGTGRRKKFQLIFELTKPINPARIFAFLQLFSQRKKLIKYFPSKKAKQKNRFAFFIFICQDGNSRIRKARSLFEYRALPHLHCPAPFQVGSALREFSQARNL